MRWSVPVSCFLLCWFDTDTAARQVSDTSRRLDTYLTNTNKDANEDIGTGWVFRLIRTTQVIPPHPHTFPHTLTPCTQI